MRVFLQQSEGDGVYGKYGFGVCDEVTELGVAFVADGLVQREGFPGVALVLQHLFRGSSTLIWIGSDRVQFDVLMARVARKVSLRHFSGITRDLIRCT